MNERNNQETKRGGENSMCGMNMKIVFFCSILSFLGVERIAAKDFFNPPSINNLSINAAPKNLPANTKLTCLVDDKSIALSESCPVLVANGYTYWPLSYIDNRMAIGLAAFNTAGQFVEIWELSGARYAYQMEFLAKKTSIKIRGQANKTVDFSMQRLLGKSHVSILLKPNVNNACDQMWKRNEEVFGLTGGECSAKKEVEPGMAFIAAKDLCQRYDIVWFDFNLTGKNFQDSTMLVDCIPSSSTQSPGFRALMDDMMQDYSKWSQLRASNSIQDVIRTASMHGIDIREENLVPENSDLWMEHLFSSEHRRGGSNGKCGGLGQRGCICKKFETVYWPFGFCCIPRAKTCAEGEFRSNSCNFGYELDSSGYCTSPVVTVDAAIQAGCRTEQEIVSILERVSREKNVSLNVQDSIADYKSELGGDWMTKIDVTDPDTVVYRGTDIPAEIEAFKAGQVLSKAQRRIEKIKSKGKPLDTFWEMHGPEVLLNERSDMALAMQIIGVRSTDTPINQYVPVALDYKIAKGYAGADHTVYSFQVKPNSPVLGLRSCKLKSHLNEDQMLIHGGAAIHKLRRKVGDKDWENWDSARKKWYQPFNPIDLH